MNPFQHGEVFVTEDGADVSTAGAGEASCADSSAGSASRPGVTAATTR
ncbi:hypothetical protein AB4Z39_24685 [Mycobacterium adipatum]